MRSNTSQKNMPSDWHNADINAGLRKAGTNFSKLAEENNLARGTLRNALYRPYPRAEKIIADAMGLEPKDIWASRYS
ncbi:helix-turn-helix transcriptional regulator [Psychrobacter sp. HD31]|uniref:helix-turn-helix domain-containing protein n=1 Tax=Psychrobacter sp. HD31 TaxID=3112003 RepID=UPI003DA44ABF